MSRRRGKGEAQEGDKGVVSMLLDGQREGLTSKAFSLESVSHLYISIYKTQFYICFI